MPTTVFPVIHLQSTAQAVAQASLALGLGSDGVYLIDHHHGYSGPLLEAVQAVIEAHPDAFVGVNLLCAGTGLEAFTMLARACGIGTLTRLPDAVWVDDARHERDKLQAMRQADPRLAGIRYLGGTSFKYTSAYTEDPATAAAEAAAMAPYVDVVCTSGPGTGHATTPARVAAMKQAIGSQPLAVASGVDVENIGRLRPYVDEVLVATSIETTPGSGLIDSLQLTALLAAARA
jgi:predicted TIM-barrel enzyme